MRLFRIQSSLLASFFLLALLGCAINQLDLSIGENRDETVSLLMPFSQQEMEAIYKAQIDISGQYYSGIIAISSKTSENPRIVFINELGMKFFEVEISSKGLTVKHAIEPFQRRPVISILEEMFTPLFLKLEHDELGVAMIDDSEEYIVYQVKRNGNLFYFINHSSGRIERIEKIGWFTRKMITQINYEGQLPESIQTSFPGKKVDIILTHFED